MKITWAGAVAILIIGTLAGALIGFGFGETAHTASAGAGVGMLVAAIVAGVVAAETSS